MIVNGYSIEPVANLRDADLRGADLPGAVLSGADLFGAIANDATSWPENLHAALGVRVNHP